MKLVSTLLTLTVVLAQTLTPTTNTSIPGSQIHPVIIIGAGIAGIASSKELTAHNVPHLIL